MNDLEYTYEEYKKLFNLLSRQSKRAQHESLLLTAINWAKAPDATADTVKEKIYKFFKNADRLDIEVSERASSKKVPTVHTIHRCEYTDTLNLLYKISFNEVPLWINGKEDLAIVARWRLEVQK